MISRALTSRYRSGALLFALLACGVCIAANCAETNTSYLIERDVPATMRDGTILRADVHRPRNAGPHPVLVTRTPYGKHKQKFDRYIDAGYVVVCQDVRGRYASDGTWESWLRPVTHDAEDGFDSVQWAARLPGSNGRVGTIGFSYSALLQWKLAALRPPALLAMSAHSIPARYTDLEGPGTIRPGRRLRWSAVTMAPEMRRRSNTPGTHTEAEASALWDQSDGKKWLWFMPWTKLPREIFEEETPYLISWIKHPQTEPWDLEKLCRQISVPNLEVTGWYDHAKGDMLMQRSLMQHGKTRTARNGSRMVIGPWSHFPPGGRKFGSIDFGPEADLDLAALDVRWFDTWLKGNSRAMETNPPVRIFVMGDNTWRDEPEWPLRRAKTKSFYLSSAGNANTPAGDGKLLWTRPAAASSDHYTYDPADPVPTLFGPGNFTCATDQRPLSNRMEILVYQTEPLQHRFEVTGHPEVELFAASSAPDTDWVARLIDVAPDGMARDVCMGIVRARYRNGVAHPALIQPGKVTRYKIRLSPTSNAFLPGHRIRLDITSSDFPNYDRNHNTAADQNSDTTLLRAVQTVHHGPPQPSRILLPCIRN